MDPILRGTLENYYDKITTKEEIGKYVTQWKFLKDKGVIYSIQDAVIATLHTHTFLFFLRLQYKNIDGEEIKEYEESFMRRIPEIKSNIDLFLNK